MKLKALVCALALSAAGSLPAATLTFQFTQSGPDVVLTTSGALDDSGNWTYTADNTLPPIVAVYPSIPVLFFGSGPASEFLPKSPFSGPTNFGTGTFVIGVLDSGSSVAFRADAEAFIRVPAGYTWGEPLAAQGTFAGQTFATLGLTDGETYTWTAGLDTIEVKIGEGSSSVPEGGSTLAGLALVLAGLASVRRSIRR